MKKLRIITTVFTIFSLIFVVESFAQRGKGRIYNPQTVETISGEVVSVDKITQGRGKYYGVHIMLKTDKETISVHLGPGWYIEKQAARIEPKDKVEVKGSRITFEGKPAIIAAQVKKGEKTLKLREENGIPLWRGGRRY